MIVINSEYKKTVKNTIYLRHTVHQCKSQMIIKSKFINKGPSDHSHVTEANKLHARIAVEKIKKQSNTHTQQQFIAITNN